jgi:hypothetical protein
MTAMDKRETWTDSNGQVRTPNQWGFNSFATAEGARRCAARLGRTGSVWYIWRLADGTFVQSAVPDPASPGHPAELVEVVKLQGRPSRRKVISLEIAHQQANSGSE